MGWTAQGPNVYADGQLRWAWSADNLFQYPGGLNDLAWQVGMSADGVRDSLAEARDNFAQPLIARFRAAMNARGYRVDMGDADVSADPRFRTFVESGDLPAAKSDPITVTAVAGAPDIVTSVVGPPSAAAGYFGSTPDARLTVMDFAPQGVALPSPQDAQAIAQYQQNYGSPSTGLSGPPSSIAGWANNSINSGSGTSFRSSGAAFDATAAAMAPAAMGPASIVGVNPIVLAGVALLAYLLWKK